MKLLLLASLVFSSTVFAASRDFRSTIVTCADGTTSCDLFDQQWDMLNQLKVNPWGLPISDPHDIDVTSVWNQGIHGNRSIIVAVIDSGVDSHHPDLAGNIFVNTKEIPGNGIDDDGNGYIDDVNGWNFVEGNADTSDPAGHGTHIAGTIGARGDNGFGVKGVNWDVTILPIVYLDQDGVGNLKNSIAAVKYAVAMGARIINASWGGYTSDALRETIAWAGTQGVLFISSSGNDGENLDLYPYYPASYALDNMIVVGSSEFSDKLTGDANWGKNTVDIVAPGLNILSTLPGGQYGVMSGTSMSAPHVAGAAALLWSEHPDWDYKKVKSVLLETSVLHNEYANKVRYGRLDVAAAFAGIKNDKQFPTAWASAGEPAAYEFDKEGIDTVVLRSPGAKMMRVEFDSITMAEGKARIMINDANDTSVQRITRSQGASSSEYVYGDTIKIEFIRDEDTPLEVNLRGYSIGTP